MPVPFVQDSTIFYMNEALKLARKAFSHQEVPIGAIVVNSGGQIVGRGYNQVETKKSQSAHAEIIALAKAGKKVGDWRLNDCWVFVTLEPCSMCMNMIALSRCKGVVFGAKSPLFGYQLDKQGVFQLYKENVIETVAGLCAEDSVQLLKWFFKDRRKEKRLGREEK